MSMIKQSGKAVAMLAALSLAGCERPDISEKSTPAAEAAQAARVAVNQLRLLLPEYVQVGVSLTKGESQNVLTAVKAAREQYTALGEALDKLEREATLQTNKR